MYSKIYFIIHTLYITYSNRSEYRIQGSIQGGILGSNLPMAFFQKMFYNQWHNWGPQTPRYEGGMVIWSLWLKQI